MTASFRLEVFGEGKEGSLRELLIHTRESGGKKWRNGFLECVRMCFEDDPKLFQSMVQLSDKELQERFS